MTLGGPEKLNLQIKWINKTIMEQKLNWKDKINKTQNWKLYNPALKDKPYLERPEIVKSIYLKI